MPPVCPRCNRSDAVRIIEVREIKCARCGKFIAKIYVCYCERCRFRFIYREGEAYVVIENRFYCLECSRIADEVYRVTRMPLDAQVDLALKLVQIIEKAQQLGLPCEAFRKLFARIEEVRREREEILDREHKPIKPVSVTPSQQLISEALQALSLSSELEKRGKSREAKIIENHIEKIIEKIEKHEKESKEEKEEGKPHKPFI